MQNDTNINSFNLELNSLQIIKATNGFLTFGIIFLALYLIFMPLAPQAENLLRNNYDYVQNKKTSLGITPSKSNTSNNVNNTSKFLFISKIGVASEIYIGDEAFGLANGVWFDDLDVDLTKNKNIVLAAHRFQYITGARTFYSLPELEPKDIIELYWDGTLREYEVYNKTVVTPYDVWIKDETTQDILTLYTCEPLWTSENRIVVTARLIKNN